MVRGGILDVSIGVPDLVDALAYWQAFGYRPFQAGSMAVMEASDLYGAASGFRAVRLAHEGGADHGLVRLVQWDAPTGNGLGMHRLKCLGSRWSAALVERIARPFAHAKYAALDGCAIVRHAPDFMPANPVSSADVFSSVISGAFEMALLQPFYRQVLFERADAQNPLYGAIAPGSLMRASQFTHCCIGLHATPDSALDFYDSVLGMRRSTDIDLDWAVIGSSGKDLLGLDEGDGFRMIKFDDPRSGDGAQKRSGRLTLFSFHKHVELEDFRPRALPGALGHTIYSLRLKDLEANVPRLVEAGAYDVSPLKPNEFAERSVTASLPDGSRWQFIDAADSVPVSG
jgi:catechol 2,3-dioxygenase-like lactoylglutathione lyase family enzyme